MNKVTKDNVVYAGFGLRILSNLVDIILSAILLSPIFTVIKGWMGISGISFDQLPTHRPTYDDLMIVLVSYSDVLLFESILIAIIIIFFWIYRSATPGKMLFRMKIVDATTFGKPTTGQLILRYLGYYVAGIPLFLGFIWIYYDKRHQGWHDKMGNTVVIISRGQN